MSGIIVALLCVLLGKLSVTSWAEGLWYLAAVGVIVATIW